MRARPAAAATLAATALLPLLGAWVSGRDLAPVFRFPPRMSVPIGYPQFSWMAVVLVLAPSAALALAWQFRSSAAKVSASASAPAGRRRRFPVWGWIAAVWIIVWWVLAWNRLTWFAPLQRFTFFPLWLGFIIVANALTFERAGACGMTRAPRRWLLLFVLSAGFWWVFEWLNRFSRNWHYLGVADFGAFGYAANATLCFSTVLPAVAAVRELLGSYRSWEARLASGPRFRWMARPPTGLVLVLGGAAGLAGTGADPVHFYPALWAAPLAIVLGLEVTRGTADAPASAPPRGRLDSGAIRDRTGLASEVAVGDWRRVASWAVAALICGGFWEMWNVHSAAKWIYTVPYVDRWHVFEMPLLGYLGYLPFGLECRYAVDRVLGTDWPPFSSASST